MNAKKTAFLFAVLTFLMTASADCILRYREGLNSFPVHARIQPASGRKITQVVMTSIHGGQQDLKLISDNGADTWSTGDNRAPLEDLEFLSNHRLSPEDIELRFGLTWESAWINYSPRELVTTALTSTSPQSGQQFSTKIAWQKATRTLLPGIKVGRNWQGDLWLFLPSICKGILATFFVSLALRLFSCTSPQSSAFGTAKLFMPITCAIGTVAFIGLSIYLSHTTRSLIQIVDGRGFFIAFLTAAIAIAGIAFATYLLSAKAKNNGDLRPSTFAFLIFLSLVLVAKFAFVYTANLTQTGDFRDYQKLGEEFADGTIRQNWDHSYPLLPVLASRAFAFSYPWIAVLGATSIGYINCLLQIATAFLVASIAKNGGAGRFANIAAISFLFWPDFLFSTPITSHDISGYFWLALGVALIAKTHSVLLQPALPVAPPLKNKILYWLVAAITGVSVTMLEWTRGFAPFLLASVILQSIISVASSRDPAYYRQLAKWVGWLAIVVISCFLSSKLLKDKFYQIVGNVKSTSLSDYIVSDSTRSDSVWYSMHPFRFSYIPVVPEELSGEFKLRKLLYEKCVLANEMPVHMNKKLAVLARSDDYVHIFKTSYEGRNTRKLPERLEEILRILCHLLTICFTLTMLTRIIYACTRSLSTTEWLIYGVAFFQLGAVLFLTESAGTYDAVIGLCAPVALSNMLNSPFTPLTYSQVRVVTWSIAVRTFLGSSILMLCWSLLFGFGILLNRTNFSFYNFKDCTVETNGDSENYSIDKSDARIVIRYLGRASENSLANQVSSCSFILKHTEKAKLQGFLSGNQYQDAVPSSSRFAQDIGKFALYCGDAKVTEGDLSELNAPKWISLEFSPEQITRIDITVDVSQLNLLKVSPNDTPAIALEFFSAYSPGEQ